MSPPTDNTTDNIGPNPNTEARAPRLGVVAREEFEELLGVEQKRHALRLPRSAGPASARSPLDPAPSSPARASRARVPPRSSPTPNPEDRIHHPESAHPAVRHHLPLLAATRPRDPTRFDHAAVIDALDKVLVPNTSNAELKQLLVDVRPAFEAHLAHAKKLQGGLGASK
jgi:hypothetical protein